MREISLDSLNPSQREAVLEVGAPLMVVAGAGSGKTNVITHKIAHLVGQRKYQPGQVLGVTFTNRAAGEMKDRIHILTGIPRDRFQISTFHSLGLKILRESGNVLDFHPDWHVVDEGDQKQILDRIIKENFPLYTNDMREAVRRKINLFKMNLNYPNDPVTLRSHGMDDDEIKIYTLYHEFQKINFVWDYEDLVSYTVKLLQNNVKVRHLYNDRFGYIVVDEFQDTNPNQYELIKLLSGENRKITVVGDDDQAIYSWRGANVRFLLDFERDFPGTRIIKLEQNYRSTKPILQFANQVIQRNTIRRKKEMFTEKQGGNTVSVLHSYSKEEEARKIVDLIAEIKERRPERMPIAVLYRINSQSLAFETELLKRDISFAIVKGLRFFERKEIKDCLALMKLVFNPNDDVSFVRAVGFLPLGIGAKTLSAIASQSRQTKGSLFSVLKAYFPEKFGAKKLFPLIEKLHERRTEESLSGMLETLLDGSGYRQILADKTEQSRLFNIDELIQFVGRWQAENPNENFGSLLDKMAVDSGSDRRKMKNGIFLLTMHNAKGTEFPTVIVAGINQTYMPFFLRKGREEWEEERRLFYVAVTRGIQDVVVSDGSDRPSRFLREIDARFFRRFFEVDDLFERVFLDHRREAVANDAKPGGRYLAHPVFGKGRIVKSINEETFLIEFEEGGEKVIDTSRVQVEFL